MEDLNEPASMEFQSDTGPAKRKGPSVPWAGLRRSFGTNGLFRFWVPAGKIAVMLGEHPERERLEVARMKVTAAMYGWGITLQKHPRVLADDIRLLVNTMSSEIEQLIAKLKLAEEAWEPILARELNNARPKARKRPAGGEQKKEN